MQISFGNRSCALLKVVVTRFGAQCITVTDVKQSRGRLGSGRNLENPVWPKTVVSRWAPEYILSPEYFLNLLKNDLAVLG